MLQVIGPDILNLQTLIFRQMGLKTFMVWKTMFPILDGHVLGYIVRAGILECQTQMHRQLATSAKIASSLDFITSQLIPLMLWVKISIPRQLEIVFQCTESTVPTVLFGPLEKPFPYVPCQEEMFCVSSLVNLSVGSRLHHFDPAVRGPCRPEPQKNGSGWDRLDGL